MPLCLFLFKNHYKLMYCTVREPAHVHESSENLYLNFNPSVLIRSINPVKNKFENQCKLMCSKRTCKLA